MTTIRKDPKFWITDSEIHNVIKEKGEFVPEEAAHAQDALNNVEDDKSIPYSTLRAHITQYNANTISAANRFMRIPRLPLILFPMLFQFIKKISCAPSEQSRRAAEFYLQNLISTCLLRAKHYYKIELTFRELNNFQKNEKFRRNVKLKGTPLGKTAVFKALQGFDEEVVSLVYAFSEFCATEGMNLFAVFDKFQEMRAKEEECLAFTLNYCYQGYLKFLSVGGPASERVFKMTKRRLDESTAFFHYDYYTPPEYSTAQEVFPCDVEALNCLLWSQQRCPGVFYSKMFYDESQVGFMAQKFLAHYESVGERTKRSYRYYSVDRVPWTDRDFTAFYRALELYNHEALANKRIAKYMGKHIDPNHVRYERQQHNKRRKLEEQKTLS